MSNPTKSNAAASTSATNSSSSTELETTKKAGSALNTESGQTSISDSVVSKIAGMAAREVTGVHDLGGGTARVVGAVRERIAGGRVNVQQGISVEVGEQEAAVDVGVVAEYGVAIHELAEAIRRNVIISVERMTGLKVTEVNVTVHDVHLPQDDDNEQDEQSASN